MPEADLRRLQEWRERNDLLLQDVIVVITAHWQIVVGTLFVLLILFFPRGIWGSILHWSRR